MNFYKNIWILHICPMFLLEFRDNRVLAVKELIYLNDQLNQLNQLMKLTTFVCMAKAHLLIEAQVKANSGQK